MVKIKRQTQKIFAGNAVNSELAVFGSMVTGNPIYTDNLEALQSDKYELGWISAIAANEAPFHEELNGVQYGFSKQLAYLFQEGIPEYDNGTTYYKNSIIKSVDSNNNCKLYSSLKDNNLNKPLSDTTSWQALDFSEIDYVEYGEIEITLPSGISPPTTGGAGGNELPIEVIEGAEFIEI